MLTLLLSLIANSQEMSGNGLFPFLTECEWYELVSLLLALTCPSMSFRLGFPRIPVVETGHWFHSETPWTHVPLGRISMACSLEHRLKCG